MSLFIVTYHEDVFSDGEARGVYATFDEAVNAILQNHKVDPYEVFDPLPDETPEMLGVFLNKMMEVALKRWGKTTFQACDYFIHECEVGVWSERTLPKNVTQCPELTEEFDRLFCAEIKALIQSCGTPTDFDMETYMNKRF